MKNLPDFAAVCHEIVSEASKDDRTRAVAAFVQEAERDAVALAEQLPEPAAQRRRQQLYPLA